MADYVYFQPEVSLSASVYHRNLHVFCLGYIPGTYEQDTVSAMPNYQVPISNDSYRCSYDIQIQASPTDIGYHRSFVFILSSRS